MGQTCKTKGWQRGTWWTSVHPASGRGWRSNHRAILSRLDEHDERHRPSIQTIDIRPARPPVPWGYTSGTRYTCCRFWLLSTDVTDLPRSPRDTNLSIYPPGKDGEDVQESAGIIDRSPDVRQTSLDTLICSVRRRSRSIKRDSTCVRRTTPCKYSVRGCFDQWNLSITLLDGCRRKEWSSKSLICRIEEFWFGTINFLRIDFRLIARKEDRNWMQFFAL